MTPPCQTAEPLLPPRCAARFRARVAASRSVSYDPGGCRAGTGPPAHAGLGGARGPRRTKGPAPPQAPAAGLLTGGRCRPLPAPGRRASGGRGGAAEQSRALGAERRPPARTPSPAGWLRAPRTWRRRWGGTPYLSTGPTASARTGESSSSSKGAPAGGGAEGRGAGVEGGPAPAAACLPACPPPARPGGRTQSLTGACFPLLPRSDLTRTTTWLHPRTGEPVNSGHMIRSGGCPGAAGRLPRPAFAPRPVNGRFAPPRSAASEALRGRSSHPSFPAFFLFPSVPLPCRPAPRMGGGVLGGGRQLLHRVSNCPAPRGALAARPWPGRGAASGGWGGAGPLPPPTGPDPARPPV